MEIKNGFPEVPNFQATWAPIYMEPILGSGERITVGIAAQTQSGNVAVRSTLSEKKIKCAFGKNGLVLLDSALFCLDDLSKYLKEKSKWESWEAPLSGVEIGSSRPTAGRDIEEIIRIAMHLTAAFGGAARESTPEIEVQQPSQEDLDPWQEQIKKYVSRQRPLLENNFYRMVNIVEGGTKTKFDYYGPRYVANFGKLFPLDGALNQARVKICTLASLRGGGNLNLGHYELILLDIQQNSLHFSKSHLQNFERTKIEILEEARRNELSTLTVFGPEDASNRILEFEAT